MVLRSEIETAKDFRKKLKPTTVYFSLKDLCLDLLLNIFLPRRMLCSKEDSDADSYFVLFFSRCYSILSEQHFPIPKADNLISIMKTVFHVVNCYRSSEL
jgi:hypothetical protein